MAIKFTTATGAIAVEPDKSDDFQSASGTEIERLENELAHANEANGMLVEECERLRETLLKVKSAELARARPTINPDLMREIEKRVNP